VRVRIEGATDIGRRRRRNEDSWLGLPEDNLAVVADGMGGHGSGDVASQLAVATIKSFFSLTAPESENTWPHVATDERVDMSDFNSSRLVSAIQFAHRRIATEVQATPGLAGMGTTVVCAHFVDDKAYIANVGDSRCYCLSDGALWQVTDDHTLANHVRSRFDALTADQEARLQALSHVVVRALGGSDPTDAQVDLTILEPRVGDTFVLCSDGLSGELSDDQIRTILVSGNDLGVVCQRLVEAANEAGGRDNITVVAARIEELSRSRAPQRRQSDLSGQPDEDETCEEIVLR
jgi:serine/threonine protein phosphatase PrpC